MQNKRHLNQDGVGFYKALRAVYRSSLIRGALRKQFASLNIAKIKPAEYIDSFAARLVAEKNYIEESTQFQQTIDNNNMKDIFIFGLSPDFTDLKKKRR